MVGIDRLAAWLPATEMNLAAERRRIFNAVSSGVPANTLISVKL
jgi:hypothetical protein